MGELERSNLQVQDEFTTLGEHFKNQVLLTDKLLAKGKSLTSSTHSEEDSDLFSRAIELIDNSIKFAISSSERNECLIDSFARYRNQYEIVRKGEAQLARTLVPLQIIERLFRIEAASLRPELQSSFESLTKEIAGLHNEMRKILDDQFAMLRETGDKIDKTRIKLVEHSQKLGQMVAKTRHEIDVALMQIDLGIENNRTRNLKIAEATRKISGKTDQVMIGLQQQDFMNQRCQHVFFGIDKLIKELEFSNKPRSPRSIKVLAPLIHLENKQLESIQNELDGAYVSIAEGFQDISILLNKVGEDHLSKENLERTVDSVNEVVESLLHSIEQSRNLVDLAESGAIYTTQAVETFNGNATNVTSTLRDIASGIKLIAINAQIQAAQIGEGTGLEVLSGRTCDLSDETGTYTLQIGKELESLMQLLESVLTECEDIKTHSRERIEILDTDGNSIRSSMKTYQTAASEGLRDFSNLLREGCTNAHEMISLSRFSRSPQATIESIRSILTEAEESLPQKFDSRKSSLKSILPDLLEHNYTMDSERRVHEEAMQVFHTKKPSTNSRLKAQQDRVESEINQGNEEQLSENIELF